MYIQYLLMQVELFCNAKIVIGPHGAGLTNTCFMEKGTVIEIGSEDINLCCANMSSLVENANQNTPQTIRVFIVMKNQN